MFSVKESFSVQKLKKYVATMMIFAYSPSREKVWELSFKNPNIDDRFKRGNVD